MYIMYMYAVTGLHNVRVLGNKARPMLNCYIIMMFVSYGYSQYSSKLPSTGFSANSESYLSSFLSSTCMSPGGYNQSYRAQTFRAQSDLMLI